jgi:hypothetical protein
MLIEFRNGKRKEVKPAVGKYFIKIGTGREVSGGYLTRDMADQPKVVKLPVFGDGLDEMEKAELHALAKERGLQLHHMLGAEKVRAALRGESQE